MAQSSQSNASSEVMTAKRMRMPEAWWLRVELPNEWENKIVSDAWLASFLDISKMNKQVAINLRKAQPKTDKCLSWVKNVTICDIG